MNIYLGETGHPGANVEASINASIADSKAQSDSQQKAQGDAMASASQNAAIQANAYWTSYYDVNPPVEHASPLPWLAAAAIAYLALR